MTHQNLVLTEKAIKSHAKRLQKELKNYNQELSLGETQNLFSKSLGFNSFHELKKIIVENKLELAAEEIENLSKEVYKNNCYKLTKEEIEQLEEVYVILFDFVIDGDLENLQKLLFKNPDLNLNFIISNRTWKPKSIIEFALSFEHIEIVNYLIDNFKNIDLHISDAYLIRHACIGGHLTLIIKLLKLTHYNYSTLNNSFILACHYGHLEVIKYLLKEENIDIHFYGNSALKDACKFGQLHIVEYLLTSTELKENSNIFADDGSDIKTGYDIRDMFIWELGAQPQHRYWDKDRSKLFKILNYIINDYNHPEIKSWLQEKKELKRYIY